MREIGLDVFVDARASFKKKSLFTSGLSSLWGSWRHNSHFEAQSTTCVSPFASIVASFERGELFLCFDERNYVRRVKNRGSKR